MNNHTENTLKGVSTLKLGVEFKPNIKLSLRLGYNYVSPMYEEYGSKDGTIDSWGSYYSSSTDYTNWKATNRFTCGLGYNFGNMTIDLAYQYSAQSGDFRPFKSGTYKYYNEESHVEEQCDNICDAVNVSNNRHQLLLTFGYHF